VPSKLKLPVLVYLLNYCLEPNSAQVEHVHRDVARVDGSYS
jgi:hypothetical protein